MFNILSDKGNGSKNDTESQSLPIRMGIIKKKTKLQMPARMCGEDPLYTIGWECTLVQPLWKSLQSLLQNLKIDTLSFCYTRLGHVSERYINIQERQPCLSQQYSQ
jgi:hypothetical protein